MRYLLKIALGNLKKSSFTSFLNLIGLTSAFAAVILIMMYVWNERHFDTFNKHFDEIYRLEVKTPTDEKTSVYLLGPTGQTLVDEFPEIETSTTYMPWGKWEKTLFSWENSSGEIKSYEDYSYTDEKLTDVFTFNILKGEQENPLAEPHSAIVSEDFARKAWGDADPIGKILKTTESEYAKAKNYVVTAVFARMPENSVIQSPVLLKLPDDIWLGQAAKEWDIINYPQFIRVKQGTDPGVLNEKINSQSIVRDKYSFYQKGNEKATLIARPLGDLHFCNETAENPLFTTNSRLFVNSLFWVGILILLVALINYINFATANVPTRIKSISITRILGGNRLNTFLTFQAETLILFLISYLAALGLVCLANRWFSVQVIGYQLPLAAHKMLLFAVGLMILGLAVLSSVYPAVYSMHGKTVDNLKRFRPQSKVNFRGILSVSQFTATIVLVAISVLIIKQVRFMEKTNLGFNKNSTLVIQMNKELHENTNQFKEQLKSCPYITDMACSWAVPGVAQEMHTLSVNGENCPIWYWAVDDNYMNMMNFRIKEGRSFLKDSKAETGNMICNEAAIKKYGWKLGMQIGQGKLVGIMNDFNYTSLREQVEPFAFWYSDNSKYFRRISLKLANGSLDKALPEIEKIYNSVSPEMPMQYYFLDDHLNMLYANERQQVELITFFSLLSAIISILGIWGMSIFICQYKIKEIGIRKVNGAKISEVISMLNKDFLKWVIIAIVISIPVAWYAMHRWLEGFAYRTGMSWWIFALSGILALIISLLTVSRQSWKAATKNPVEALRYE